MIEETLRWSFHSPVFHENMFQIKDKENKWQEKQLRIQKGIFSIAKLLKNIQLVLFAKLTRFISTVRYNNGIW